MLRTECDDLRVRARDSEDMLLRDSDIKVQVSQQCHKLKCRTCIYIQCYIITQILIPFHNRC
jgi:hypothetical protein